ncbi:lactonase family protein [Streptomyces sp. NBC_00536]|uniref:lactonase family protein n=1 Tax=Streptomyces sp. NBC_00536 TaxID=2975769 RepID=UPI002E821061|nr:lactonase family protein [Streptomyces sp. NBC_00536]WUC83583.1 lactonase family protein [Streptomyces sp. NBC_00536]
MGSFTSTGGRGITTADVDPATGALTPVGATDALADPSYLALAVDAADAPVLYAVSETKRGAVGAFRPSGAAGLVPLGSPVAVDASGPTHLSVSGNRLLTANYTSGSVSTLARAADGRPTGPASVLRHHGSGPDADRQGEPHAHQVLPDPGGRWVLSVDLGTDSVRVCALDAASGALRVHSEAALAPGNGPRHLAFHPGGALLYVLNELRPLLTVCRWDAAAGTVEPVAEVPVAPEGGSGAVRAYPSALVVSPDGRFLWAAVRGLDLIAALALPGDGAKPLVTGSVPCGGRWPRDLALDPAGRRLYAANEHSGDVTWFDVDPLTGLPRRAGSAAVPAATCVVFG